MPALKRPKTEWGTPEKINRYIAQIQDPDLRKKLTVIWMLMVGYSQEETAQYVGVSCGTARNWRRRWDEEGVDGLVARNLGPPEWSEARQQFREGGCDLKRISQRFTAIVPANGHSMPQTLFGTPTGAQPRIVRHSSVRRTLLGKR